MRAPRPRNMSSSTWSRRIRSRVAHHLHVGMAIADVPGEPGKVVRGRRGDFDQRLGLAGDAHDGAVVEHEAVAVTQRGRMRQIEQECRAALAGQRHAAAMAVAGIEHDAVDRFRRVPGAGRPDRGCASHRIVSLQNKKYRCAIGSTSAGAQVSNSPSAVTS